MIDNALSYEYLIRRAHQCGRYGSSGADADIYRELQRSANEYFLVQGKSVPKEAKLLSDYMISLGKVSAYIDTAIDLVLKKYSPKLSDQQYNILEEVKVTLKKPDINIVEKAIKDSEGIMIAIGLYPK